MIGPRRFNRLEITAMDIVKRIFDVLNDATDRPKNLKLLVSPYLHTDSFDLPFLAIDIHYGDSDSTSLSHIPATHVSPDTQPVSSLITLNFRVDMTTDPDNSNNGIKLLAPLRNWAMFHIYSDSKLKDMTFDRKPIPKQFHFYETDHDKPTKGLIQGIEFRHLFHPISFKNEY